MSDRTAYTISFTLTINQDAADNLPAWPGHLSPDGPAYDDPGMTGPELMTHELMHEMVGAAMDHLERRHPDLDAFVSLGPVRLDKTLTALMNATPDKEPF